MAASFEDKELREQYINLVKTINKNSPAAMKTSKEMLLSYKFVSLKQSLKEMSELNAEFRQTSDFKEGITSFLDKTKPGWVN